MSYIPEYTVLLIGPTGVGKTRIFQRIMNIYNNNMSSPRIFPTIGLNTDVISLKTSKLRFWDLGGARDLWTIWNSYLSKSDVVLLVFKNSSDPIEIKDCFEIAKRFVHKSKIILVIYSETGDIVERLDECLSKQRLIYVNPDRENQEIKYMISLILSKISI